MRSHGGEPHERFERVIAPHRGFLVRLCRSISASSADADDLVQDVLIKAYRHLESFDGCHPRAWLARIARNTAIDRARRRGPVTLEPFVTGETPVVGREAEEPEQQLLAVDRRRVVRRILDELPADYRRAVELVDLDGLAYREAAEALDVPVGTVTSRVHRGRRRILEALAGAGSL